jgi:hypothetical protein
MLYNKNLGIFKIPIHNFISGRFNNNRKKFPIHIEAISAQKRLELELIS